MNIRPASLADIPAIARIHKRQFTGHLLGQYSTTLIGSFYRTFLDRSLFLVHESNNGVVDGFVLGMDCGVYHECRRRFIRTAALRAVWETLWRPRVARSALLLVCRGLRTPPPPPNWIADFRLLSIAVDEQAAGTGVGRALVVAFETRLRERCVVYGLSVKASNARAIRFYQKLGFEVEHVAKNEWRLRKWLADGHPPPKAPAFATGGYLKRSLDVSLSLAGLILLSPVMLAAALLVKLTSPGPVVFRQQRVGRGFRPFWIYKFRTMYQDAPARGGPITVGEDPRITFAGRWLRKSKLDELPQLFNVLRGDMSLVGPRPEAPRYVELFRRDYEEILRVRPGITDLASIKYRDEAALLAQADDPEREYLERVLPDKLRLARQYIRRSSPAFDLWLMAATVLKVCLPRREASLP